MLVSKHDAQVRSMAEQQLASGEEVVAVALVNYNGTVPPASLPGSAGRSDDPDAKVIFPSARQMALALTGGRILVFNLGFSGKPKNHIGDVPLGAVDHVEQTGLRFGSMQLRMRSGAVVDLEFLAGEKGEAFFEQLDDLVEPPPARDPSERDLPSWDPRPAGSEPDEPASPGGDDDTWLPPPVPPPPGGWDEGARGS